MAKKLEARIASIIAVTAALIAVLQKWLLAEEDNITGEVSSKIMKITFRFESLF